MADNGKGTTMGRLSCNWAHDWLPLLVDDSDGLACEGNDMTPEDRRLLEQHLTECSSCRQHRAALVEAISVLSVAAADLATEPRTPSLWAQLEKRIERDRKQSPSRWIQVIRTACPEGMLASADRLFCGYNQFLSNLPLQLAWTRDSLGDILREEVRRVIGRRGDESGEFCRFVTPRLGVGLSLAAFGIVLFFLVGFMHQHRQNPGETPVAARTAPVPSVQTPLLDLPEASEDVVTSTSSSTISRASNSPSLATSPALDTATSMGQVATAKAAAITTTTTATATSAPRYDFDLEHGTLLPPETRTGTPAY